jgi:peptide/nickel transport system substrate-binding protein
MKFALTLVGFLMAMPQAHAAQKGDCGTIVLPTGGGDGPSDDINSFSPLFADNAYSEESGWLLYPNLLWINRFSQIDWSRSLASAVTTTDNTVFTITLRPWHWSDGVPLTARDVIYTFGLDKQLGPTWPGYGGGGMPYIVKSIKLLSPTQLQITTTHPVNPTWFIYNGIGPLEPVPEHAWKKYTLDQMEELQSTPAFFNVVDGPVKIEKLDIGMDAVFVPNPAWEGPKMHFSRLVFEFLEGDGANVQGVESGAFDVAAVPTDMYSSVQSFPGTHLELLPQSALEDVIAMNFHNPAVAFFRDVRVRQAMEDAIDQNAIVQGLQHGNGDAAYGPVPHSFTQFLPPEMQAGHYPVGYDPAKSRALLEAAGFTPGPDGIMQKNGKRLSFTYLEETGTDAIIELDEILQADFRDVGIEMKLHLTQFNLIMALMNGPPTGWEATGFGQPSQPYPSGEGQYATGANQNQGGYSDPEMDRLIEDNTEKPDIKYLYAYENYASAQQPVIFSPRLRPVILVRNRLHGMSDFLDPVGMFAPDQLYCTAEGGAQK